MYDLLWLVQVLLVILEAFVSSVNILVPLLYFIGATKLYDTVIDDGASSIWCCTFESYFSDGLFDIFELPDFFYSREIYKKIFF